MVGSDIFLLEVVPFLVLLLVGSDIFLLEIVPFFGGHSLVLGGCKGLQKTVFGWIKQPHSNEMSKLVKVPVVDHPSCFTKCYWAKQQLWFKYSCAENTTAWGQV